MLENFYHLCSKAFPKNLLCYDEADYKALWNTTAICALTNDVKIYCICLMSNHIHILLSGLPNNIQSFFSPLKQKNGIYLKKKYPENALPVLEYDLFPVHTKKIFCREVAYILRNPYKAGISSPFSYRWSSAPVYFTPRKADGIPISKIKTKEYRTLLQTRYQLPETIALSDGMITAESFVDGEFVETMFERSSVQFFNMVKTWNLEDIVNESHGLEVIDNYSDDEVKMGINEVCQDLFRCSSIQSLDSRCMVTLVRRIHSRFGCSRKQLMRLLPIDETQLERIL